MKFILCIDDDPIRYRGLRQEIAARGLPLLVVHTCRQEDVVQYLDKLAGELVGVCLDHDMPFQDGQWFVRQYLQERNHPVVVVSHNTPMADSMAALLQDYEVPVIKVRAGSPGFENLVLTFFNY
jgi:CheY-like chemotaxis protein